MESRSHSRAGTEAEDRLERLTRHPALGGPELQFLTAQLAHRRGDLQAARGTVRQCLTSLPGHPGFLEFAIEVGATLPPVADRIAHERRILPARTV